MLLHVRGRGKRVLPGDHVACKLAPVFFSRHASDRVNVPPQKLFDYLDGKLPAPEREELEQEMAERLDAPAPACNGTQTS